MELRDYQKECIEKLYNNIRKGSKRALLVAPTGAGKTAIASKIVSDITRKGKRVMFVVDMEALVGQTAKSFQNYGIEFGFIKSGYREDREALAQIASVQTLPRRDWWKEHHFDVIILDECHETAYRNAVKDLMISERETIFLGLTATPYRLKKRENLGDIFDSIVAAPVPSKLMEMGYLCSASYFSVMAADLGNVRTKAGDYHESDLAIACDKPELHQRLVSEWKRLAYGKRTIGFAVSVEHARNITRAFKEAGIPAEVLTGETDDNRRKQLRRDLANGSLQVLMSVNALSKGFDVPSVECALLCRPTKSRAMYEQQVGRVLRISPDTGKESAIVLDQAGNVKRFGMIEDIKCYRLTHTADDDGEENPVPLKECPECQSLTYGFVMICPNCNYEYPAKEKLVLDVPLQRVFKDKNEEKAYHEFQEWIRDAYKSKHSPGKALITYQQRNPGRFPKSDWYRGAIFGESPTEDDVRNYWQHLKEIAARLKKDESWVKQCMTKEFGEAWKVLNEKSLNKVQQLVLNEEWSWAN